MTITNKVLLFAIGALMFIAPTVALANADIYVFVRESCGFCKKEKAFLAENETIKEGATVHLLDLAEEKSKADWTTIVKKHETGYVTPITLVGGEVLVGFSEEVTGKKILENIRKENRELEFYFTDEARASAVGAGTCDDGESETCTVEIDGATSNVTLPFFGEISPKETSLFLIASVLGFIDGFNPCAMWVLLTFLLILTQIGDKRKMIQVVGLFVIAEGVMYFLILNVWYKTWDFVALDAYVTPAVGLLAVGSGLYFLYRYNKQRKAALVCDVTSLEYQSKITEKIKKVVSKPMTLITAAAVIGLAFSVNIIEFACSVGIAQAFTKVLEINNLTFIGQQFYTLIYTLFYMADDFIVFGLAIWGYQKFYQFGTKYSHLSTLIGGILMLLLGLFMLFAPNALIF